MFRYNDVLQADFYEDYFLLAFKSLAWMDWSRSICSGVYAPSISFGVCACSICPRVCAISFLFGVCAISFLFGVCAPSIWCAVRQLNMKPFSGQIANSDQSGS